MESIVRACVRASIRAFVRACLPERAAWLQPLPPALGGSPAVCVWRLGGGGPSLMSTPLRPQGPGERVGDRQAPPPPAARGTEAPRTRRPHPLRLQCPCFPAPPRLWLQPQRALSPRLPSRPLTFAGRAPCASEGRGATRERLQSRARGRAPWTPGSRPRPAPRRPQRGLRRRVPIALPALSGTQIPEPASGAAHQKRRPGCRAPAAPSPGVSRQTRRVPGSPFPRPGLLLPPARGEGSSTAASPPQLPSIQAPFSWSPWWVELGHKPQVPLPPALAPCPTSGPRCSS